MNNGIVNVGIQVNNDLGYGANFEDDFTVALGCPGWYFITGDFGKLNGSVSIMQGKKSVATGTVKNGVLKFNNGKNVLLDSANDYTIVVKNTDKGKSASEYAFTLKAKTLFDNVGTATPTTGPT